MSTERRSEDGRLEISVSTASKSQPGEDAVYCEGTDSAAHDDEVQHPCSHRAVVEVFSIHGRWQPMCERHAQGYEGERRRMMAGWWTKHPAYDDLVDSFRGSTRMPEHLAFLALTGLRHRGWEVVVFGSRRDTEAGR